MDATDAAQAARAAYQALEPIHLVTYFSPRLKEVGRELGIDWRAIYVGMRAEPMGECAPAVVAAAFHNWNPELLVPAWEQALETGLSRLREARETVVRAELSDAWGETDLDAVASLAQRLRDVYAAAPVAGRPLAAAWAAAPWPQDPVLALWQATAVAREWRGDGHIAVLVTAGLSPIEALAFHEAQHPDPGVKASRMGRDATMSTRAWPQEQWQAAEQTLSEQGLLELRDDQPPLLTEAGAELFDEIERSTDDAAGEVWLRTDEDPLQLLALARPYAKAVIDAGILPGTRRRS